MQSRGKARGAMYGRSACNPPFCRAGQDSLHAGDGARPDDSQGEKGMFCKITLDDLQNKRFFEGEVSKFRGEILFEVTDRAANYAKDGFCSIGGVRCR